MRIVRSMWLIMIELIFATAGYKLMNSHPEYVKIINWPNALILTIIFLLLFKIISENMLMVTDKAAAAVGDKFKSFLAIQTIVYYSRIISNLLFINIMFLILVIGKKYLVQYSVIWMILFMQIGGIIGNLLLIQINNIDYDKLPNLINIIVDDFNDKVNNVKKQFDEDILDENKNDT